LLTIVPPPRPPPFPYTTLFRSRREVDSMTTHRSVLIGTAIVAGLTAAIRRPAPAPGPGGTPAPELTNTSWLNSDKPLRLAELRGDRKSTRLNSSHQIISYAVFC